MGACRRRFSFRFVRPHTGPKQLSGLGRENTYSITYPPPISCSCDSVLGRTCTNQVRMSLWTPVNAHKSPSTTMPDQADSDSHLPLFLLALLPPKESSCNSYDTHLVRWDPRTNLCAFFAVTAKKVSFEAAPLRLAKS